jgi:uridine phosphorylase
MDSPPTESDTQIPLLEYDDAYEAVIEPSRVIQAVDVSEHAVVCFFQDVIGVLCERYETRCVATSRSELGDHPIYEIPFDGRRLVVFHPGVGAPLAAGLLEEVIALGCRKFVACGGAGVLDKDVAVGHVVVPLSAVRDEGTSYHYLPSAREVEATPEVVAALETVLTENRVEYRVAKTWTTDAFYRETPAKVARRRAEGCLTVEMEAAAFFAVARFRGVKFGQLLYGGDDVSGAAWDSREWNSRGSVRQRLFELAAHACLRL